MRCPFNDTTMPAFIDIYEWKSPVVQTMFYVIMIKRLVWHYILSEPDEERIFWTTYRRNQTVAKYLKRYHSDRLFNTALKMLGSIWRTWLCIWGRGRLLLSTISYGGRESAWLILQWYCSIGCSISRRGMEYNNVQAALLIQALL